MNNENTWTQGREHYTLGSVGRNRGGTAEGSWGGIAWGEMPDIGIENVHSTTWKNE